MEERGNKTIMCSVLFLDIVEYSKKSVSVQISLKDRFNGHLSAAIRDVPITDRIILDTGDGAAINFLGDVEDALKTAINLRDSLLEEDINADPPLLVRMGINLGPVRLVRDINGQPNIVGDGINVAQRVMGFADVAQILVSRSYYDAVSRLSPQYAGMFHYQGSRTDKHVREHEVYAIGYPGGRAGGVGARSPVPLIAPEKIEEVSTRFIPRLTSVWNLFTSRMHMFWGRVGSSFRRADPRQRALYIGIAAVPLVLIIGLMVNLARHDRISAAPSSVPAQTVAVPAGSSVEPVPERSAAGESAAVAQPPIATPKPKARKLAEGKKATEKPKHNGAKKPPKTKEEAAGKGVSPGAKEKAGTFVSVNCKGAELFVDGTRKGRIGTSPFSVAVSPGKHTIIVSHTKGISSQDIVFAAGKTVRLSPDFCNQ